MKQRTIPEIAAYLLQNDNYIMLTHRRPDGDTVGSAAALCGGLRALGKRAAVWENPQFTEKYRPFLDGMTTDVIPENAIIIVVDIAAASLLPYGAENYVNRIDLRLDHHGRDMDFGAEGFVDASAAACGEIILDLLEELHAPVGKRIAEALYCAISTDTGCFRYSNVTPATHACAAELLSGGTFDPAEINHLLFEVKSEKLLLAERLGTERLTRCCDGALGIVTFPASLKQAHELTDEHLETLVDIPRSLEGVQVAVAVRQPTDAPAFRVSMRSNTEFDVAAVCACFGGGGHTKAAGCSLKLPLEEGLPLIRQAVERSLQLYHE